MSNFKIIAVIVLYNPNFSVMKKQFESLVEEIDQIVYIDNASKNLAQIQDYIGEVYKYIKITFISNQNNLGLGYAHNQGIVVAKTNHASHVLILDHDSILKPNFVQGLIESEVKLRKKGIKVGAIGPIYSNERTGEIYPITKYNGPFIKRILPTIEPVEASFLISSGCLIPLTVLEDVGLMDEGLFIDYIDVEWSFRARSYGYHLYASPSALMNHEIGDHRTSVLGRKISVHTPLRRYFLCRNSIHMIKNPNIPFGYKVREMTFNFLRLTVFFILSKERFKYLKFSFVGFLDGFRNIKGKCTIQS
jgi:rhamnosyltransferase